MILVQFLTKARNIKQASLVVQGVNEFESVPSTKFMESDFGSLVNFYQNVQMKLEMKI